MSEEEAVILPAEPGVAPTCPDETMLAKFNEYYTSIVNSAMAEDSALSRNRLEIIEQFNKYGLTNEEKAKLIAEMYISTTNEASKLASSSALAIIKQEAETPLKCAQVSLVQRQIQGYDESMLIKIMEQQGSLASFAINVDSNYAQDTINDLKCQMAQIQSRSEPLPDETVCIITGAPTPVPSNLSISEETDVSMKVSWLAVSSATSYSLYMDGIEIYSGGALSFEVTGLNQLTKYAFNIMATAGGNPSKLSATVVGITLVTAP